VSAAVVLNDTFPVRTAVGSEEGVSTTIYDVTTGVIRGVTTGAATGKILIVPDTCRKTSAAMTTIMAAITAPTRILDPAGLPVG
jgi:hypothetical protein